MSDTVGLSVQEDVSLICQPSTSQTRMSPCWWPSTAFEPWLRNNSALTSPHENTRDTLARTIQRGDTIASGRGGAAGRETPPAGLGAFGYVPKTVGTVRDQRWQTDHRAREAERACEDLAPSGCGFRVPPLLRRGGS